MKSCSFVHAHFFEQMEVVENLFKKRLIVKNSFIEKTSYAVGTYWNCLIEAIPSVPTTYATENKEEKYLEIYIFQVSCPLSLPLLNISNCQSVLRFLSLYCKLFIPYLHDSYVIVIPWVVRLYVEIIHGL